MGTVVSSFRGSRDVYEKKFEEAGFYTEIDHGRDDTKHPQATKPTTEARPSLGSAHVHKVWSGS
jgi:hypothetical protein